MINNFIFEMISTLLLRFTLLIFVTYHSFDFFGGYDWRKPFKSQLVY